MPRNLLALLADGEIHSGRRLGELLGVSRAAVYKQITKLSELGLNVESIKGLGYRLPAPFDLLCACRISEQLDEAVRLSVPHIEVGWRLPSTNSYCLEFMKRNSADHYVCLAEYQSEGRGRRGRQWHSALGTGLYMSVAWRFNCCAGELEGLSLAVAAVAAQVLEQEFGVSEVKLKWPNDILVADKKLGGILVELAGETAGPCSVVVGIGINTHMNENYFCKIDQPFTDMSSTAGDGDVSRNLLCAALLNGIVPLLSGYEKTGFSPFLAKWQHYDALLGKRVVVQSGVNSYRAGVAAGINSSGDFLLNEYGVICTFRSGEVSLRCE